MRLFLILLFFTITSLAIAQPQKEVKSRIDSLVSYIKNKATESFAENTAYSGDDLERKWKDVFDPANPEELKAAKLVLEELKKALAGCTYKEFDVFKEDKQKEGVWYVYTYACGADKKIHLAFLKIRGKYVLGDVDVEEEDDDD